MKKNGHIKIEKGIPVPPSKGRSMGVQAQTMLAMKKGDSCYIEKSRTSVYQLARLRLGKGKFQVREEGNGTRLWRTK